MFPALPPFSNRRVAVKLLADAVFLLRLLRSDRVCYAAGES